MTQGGEPKSEIADADYLLLMRMVGVVALVGMLVAGGCVAACVILIA